VGGKKNKNKKKLGRGEQVCFAKGAQEKRMDRGREKEGKGRRPHNEIGEIWKKCEYGFNGDNMGGRKRYSNPWSKINSKQRYHHLCTVTGSGGKTNRNRKSQT